LHGGLKAQYSIDDWSLEAMADLGWVTSGSQEKHSLLKRSDALLTSQYHLITRWHSPWAANAVFHLAQPLYVESGKLELTLPQYRDNSTDARPLQFSKHIIDMNTALRPLNLTFLLETSLTKKIDWKMGMTMYGDWHTLTTHNSPKIYFGQFSYSL